MTQNAADAANGSPAAAVTGVARRLSDPLRLRETRRDHPVCKRPLDTLNRCVRRCLADWTLRQTLTRVLLSSCYLVTVIAPLKFCDGVYVSPLPARPVIVKVVDVDFFDS